MTGFGSKQGGTCPNLFGPEKNTHHLFGPEKNTRRLRSFAKSWSLSAASRINPRGAIAYSNISASISDPSLAILVRSALQTMSAEDQRLCMLHYVMGYSHREIAAALCIRPSTSKSRLHTVRTRLRRALTD